MGSLESRVVNLENDRNALEWMVVYLAKKILMRESDPVAAAKAMQTEIEEFGQAFVNRLFQPGSDDEATMRTLGLSLGISILAERITEAVNDPVATS
ncbi:hypothetical protein [Microvirga sp. M2]|uniref:hypothetical protein n=1 Tax=Microvirga sp. M2 TaxID=3073270 RepID=UPI0039C1B0FB